MDAEPILKDIPMNDNYVIGMTYVEADEFLKEQNLPILLRKKILRVLTTPFQTLLLQYKIIELENHLRRHNVSTLSTIVQLLRSSQAPDLLCQRLKIPRGHQQNFKRMFKKPITLLDWLEKFDLEILEDELEAASINDIKGLQNLTFMEIEKLFKKGKLTSEIKALDASEEVENDMYTLIQYVPDFLTWIYFQSISFTLRDEGYVILDYMATLGYFLFEHHIDQEDSIQGRFQQLNMKKSPLGKFKKKNAEVKLHHTNFEHFWLEFSPATVNQSMSRKLVSSIVSNIDLVDKDKQRAVFSTGEVPAKPKLLDNHISRLTVENRNLRLQTEQLNTELWNNKEKIVKMEHDHQDDRERIVQTLQSTSLRLSEEMNKQTDEIRKLKRELAVSKQTITHLEALNREKGRKNSRW